MITHRKEQPGPVPAMMAKFLGTAAARAAPEAAEASEDEDEEDSAAQPQVVDLTQSTPAGKRKTRHKQRVAGTAKDLRKNNRGWSMRSDSFSHFITAPFFVLYLLLFIFVFSWL
jgi:hypothetical protein